MKFLVTLRITEIFHCIVATLTLFDMGGHKNAFDHCVQTLRSRKLKLADF